MTIDLKALRAKVRSLMFTEDEVSEVIDRCERAEQALGPAHEALQLAEEMLDVYRRELKLSGSDEDDALETAYEGVTEALEMLEGVMKQ